MQKQFRFKQFKLEYIRSLNVKTYLFQAIQFSIDTQFSSIWPIDRILSGVTTPGQSGLGRMPIKGYSVFPKDPALLEPHHQIVLCHIQDTHWESFMLYTHIIHIHLHAEHNDTIKTSDTVLRKIHFSFYWKGCVWEGVGDRTELQHIDPHSYGHNSVSFPFSWAA